jgi:carbamoyltransferase
MLFGHYLKNIKRESSLLEGNLVYPGKLMGLCGYGDIREHWLPYIEKFYRREPLSNKPNAKTLAHCSAEDEATCREVIKDLGDCIDLPIEEGIDGIAAYDLIATSQQAFENVFFNIVDPFIAQYHNLPLCITGGCALNIILNAKVKDKYKRGVFVAPNSSDCGIALGALLNIQKPQQAMNAMYSGIPLLDRKELCRNKTLRPHLIATPQVVAHCIASGNIIGVARERAEHGPRALGNRSIICNPSIPDIKGYLHSTIKKREKFRPFAPVVRAENVSRYFTFSEESPYMSFLTSVRPEWREKLAAITHIDGSARVQTVTRVQNPWLYELLGESEKLLGHGVLLNTSFNVDGAPILSTVKEAMHLLDTTCLNGVVIEEALFLKPK